MFVSRIPIYDVSPSSTGKLVYDLQVDRFGNNVYTPLQQAWTQLLEEFWNCESFDKVNDDFYLVDVPGYGYTSSGKQDQKKFGMMIEEYLSERPNLNQVFMLIDFRHKPTEDDLLMYNFLKFHGVKVTLIATKVDKIGSTQREKYKKQITDNIDLSIGDELVLFSAKTKLGKKEIQGIIAKEVYGEDTL